MSFFDLFAWTKDLISNLGYFGVFLGTFLESLFPPIPSEVIMGFAGFLVSEGRFNFWLVILAAVLGNMASATLIWWVGRRFGRQALIRWGKYIGVSSVEIEKGEKLFQRYGYRMVFIFQMIPLARSWIAFPAGILKTKYPIFILVNTLGASIWLTMLCYLGVTAGQNWDQISDWIKPFERVILILLGLLLLYWIYSIIRNSRKLATQKNNSD